MTDRTEAVLNRAADILADIHNARKKKRATSSPEEPHVGFFVPTDTEICPHCGDQNHNRTDRLCISCNHHHPEHTRSDCEQFCRFIRRAAQD